MTSSDVFCHSLSVSQLPATVKSGNGSFIAPLRGEPYREVTGIREKLRKKKGKKRDSFEISMEHCTRTVP